MSATMMHAAPCASAARSTPRSTRRERLRRRPASAAATMVHGMTEAPPITDTQLVNDCVNAIRFIAIDGVEKANSGHPGLPMGCAPMAYHLWNEQMRFNPRNPNFFNRDRFVLSAGHGSMLQYALLHLAGFPNVTTDDLASFRQIGSVTPGHPENFVTPGVEVTTGPLGMGVAMAVGLAVAEAHLAARFNKPDVELVDHYTYVIMGDGCNQEGISNEAASFAGHQGLGKLICLYDDNNITIDGHTDISFTEDVCARYEALGWHVQTVEDGNTDLDAIRKAVDAAKAVTDKPSMIKVSTIIGWGSPNKANSHDVHGAALGESEVAAARDMLKWDHAPFEVPADVRASMDHTERGAAEEAAWNATLADYAAKYPAEAEEFTQLVSLELPSGWQAPLDALDMSPGNNEAASRIHSQTCLNALANSLPGLVGGSADLAPSNMTLMKGFGDFQRDTPEGRNLRFGVREHAMGAIANGVGLHKSGLIPYCATFFIFTDYMRAAMRMAALSEAGTIFVMTHDSIGLGEDGPTHQPVEHLASFRAMPNMAMARPGDGNETIGCYEAAVKARHTPTTLALSRQKLPNFAGSSAEKAQMGAYVLSDNTPAGGTPDAIVIGTGSELGAAHDAAEEVRGATGKAVRCVSMPCWEWFDAQSAVYKESVLPKACKARVSVEAGATLGWERYVGTEGKAIGIDTFGASAPAPALYEKFGITTKTTAAALTELLHIVHA